MAEDVGQAYVGIVPSLKGFSAKLKAELAGELRGLDKPVHDAGRRAGQGFGDRMRDGIRSRLSGIGQMLKTGLAVGAAAAAAGLGALTAMGLKSAAAMEQTQIGIEALLGSTQEATKFIAELQQFAKVTPFGFADTADASRRILAFGQAVGIARDQVIPTLTTIGDLVSVLGGTSESVNSVIRALGQMASKGKLSQEEILQLAEALPGFNANAAIAAKLGVPVSDALKMITAGEVDATTGINALLEGMANFPGAAGAMAKQAGTLSGVFAAFQDTVSIALTNAFQPVIPAIKQALNAVTPIIGDALNQLAPALGGVLTAVLPLLGQVVQGLTPILTPIIDIISGALASIGDSGVLASLGQALGSLLEPLVPLGPVIGDIAAKLAGAFAPVLASLAPLLEALTPLLTEILTPLAPIIAEVADTLAAILGPAFALVAEVLKEVSPFLSVLIKDIGTALKPILQAIAPIIGKVVDALLPLVPTFADLLPSVLEIVTAFTPLSELIAALLVALTPLLTPILKLTAALISFLAQKAIVPLVEALTDAMVLLLEPIEALIEPLRQVGDWLSSLDWSAIATGIGDTLAGAWNAVVQWLSDIKTKLGETRDKVKDAFINAKDWLIEGGKDIVRGLISGIGRMAGALREKLVDIARSAWSAAKHFLGIGSPSKLFAEMGENTVAGYIKGIEGQARNVSASMTGIVAPAASGAPQFAPAPAPVPVRLESDDPMWRMFLDRQRDAIRRQFGGDGNFALSATF